MENNLAQISSLIPLIEKIAADKAAETTNQILKDSQYEVKPVQDHRHNGIDSNQITQSDVIPGLRTGGSVTFATDATTYTLGTNFNPSGVLFTGVAVRYNSTFTVTAANATEGAVYTNNSKSFVVVATIAGGVTLIMGGTGAAASGTLTKVSGTGDATITFSAVTAGSSPSVRAHIIGNAQLGGNYYLQPGVQPFTTDVGGIIQGVIQGSSFFLVDSGTSPVTVRTQASQSYIASVEYPSGTVVASLLVTSYGNGKIKLLSSLTNGWQIIGMFIIT